MTRHRRPLSRPPTPPAISNLPALRGEAGTSDATSGSPSEAGWLGSHLTNAPVIGEPEKEEPYATTGPALLEKFLRGGIRPRYKSLAVALPIIWFIAVVWVFAQDNAAGSLRDLAGLGWLGVKAAAIAGAAFVALLGSAVISRLIAVEGDD